MSDKAFYLTTPIYYVTAAPHIGNAYTTVAGDVLTRWHRQRGEAVWFLTGTDEHGEKVLRSAEEHGFTPEEWTDRLVEDAWRPVWRSLDIANDDFIRTTEPRHMERVQAFLQGLYDKDQIYQGVYEGPYCVHCEEFKLPGDLWRARASTPVSRCAPSTGVRWSTCRRRTGSSGCRTTPTPCSSTTRPIRRRWSLRVRVTRFCRSSVPGLTDLSISRSTFDWGIKVPWDPDQVVYVWFDALLELCDRGGARRPRGD